MAERPEDLNLPNAVITRIIKDAVCAYYFNLFLICVGGRDFYLFVYRIFFWQLGYEEEIKIKAKKKLHRENKIFGKIFFLNFKIPI